jgi:hypothetical protein
MRDPAAALLVFALAAACASAPEAEPFDELVEDYPVFSPDGERVAFYAYRFTWERNLGAIELRDGASFSPR